MHRRTFMKGAVIAASTPTAAFAPAAITGLAAVVAQFSEVKQLYRKALDRLDEIAAMPSPVELPKITSLDIPSVMLVVGMQTNLYSPAMIDKFFAKKAASAEGSRYMMGDAWVDQHLAEYAAVKANVIDLFEGWKAKRDLWEVTTGFHDASIEAGRLSDLMNDLDDRILYGRCETIEEVRMKANHIKSEYVGELSTEAMVKVIESLSA